LLEQQAALAAASEAEFPHQLLIRRLPAGGPGNPRD
jgi:hypothetical protein